MCIWLQWYLLFSCLLTCQPTLLLYFYKLSNTEASNQHFSLGDISYCCATEFHFHWSQCDFQAAPQCQLPEALDSKSTTAWCGFRIIPIPFQLATNSDRRYKSDRNSALRHTNQSLSLTAVITTIILLTNLQPGWTTLAACCRRPTSDFSSRRRPALCPSHSVTIACTLFNFSSGRQSYISLVSTSIPK